MSAPGPDRIELRGLRTVAAHGVGREEHDRAQPFEIDLDLHAPLARAALSDSLADTVDYGAVCSPAATPSCSSGSQHASSTPSSALPGSGSRR